LKHDSKNYEAYLEKIIAGKDSFYTTNSANAIAELETKYKVQKKEATIAQQQLALVRDNYMFYGSVVVGIFGCTIALLIFREVRRKQKQRIQQLRDEEQRRSTEAVASGQEKERKRIAADLHDNLGAQLSFIKRNVNFIIDRPEGFNRTDERKYLDQVNDTAQNAMVDLRETIWVLNRYEVSVQEFADKLKSYLRQQLMDRKITNWEFKDDISENWMLSSGEVMHLFRIVQEVISNIIKHACADHISINLNSHGPDTYELEIIDNGKGFDVDGEYDGHYGLENIQARSATVNARILIESTLGKGTRVLLTKMQNSTHELYDNVATADKFN
jgi:signal transduction histidine kinase